MKKLRLKSNKGLAVVITLLVALIAIAVVSLGVRLGTSQTYTALSSEDYVVGTLNADGEFAKDGGTIVTEDFIEIDGLKVDLDENSKLSYKLHFFNEDKEFISSTNAWGVDYNGTIPEDAEYFKVSIHPVEDDDISQFDILNYTSKISVKYYK